MAEFLTGRKGGFPAFFEEILFQQAADRCARFGLQVALLRSLARGEPSKNFPGSKGAKTMKVKMNAKLAIRIAILTVAMVGAFIAATFQPVSAADGGPLLLCQPGQKNCKTTPMLPLS